MTIDEFQRIGLIGVYSVLLVVYVTSMWHAIVDKTERLGIRIAAIVLITALFTIITAFTQWTVIGAWK